MVRLTQIFKNIELFKKAHEFMATGFRILDDSLDGGFMRKELIVLGGHTGIGKSYIAGQLFFNMAKQGFNSAYFSLEISNEMVATRILGGIANIKPTRLMVGLLTPEENKLRIDAKASFQAYESLMAFYDDKYKLAEIAEEIRKNKYDFVVIDFIQNVMHEAKDEYTRLSAISLELQKLAKECNCTILALSQLSNSVAREGQGGKVVEYKGSGSIAMVADLGFFIERGDIEEGLNIQKVNLSLRKNRRGISGLVFELFFKIPGGLLYESA